MEMIQNIKDLIPHRFPFLFLDEIISVSREEIVGENIFEGKEWSHKDEICNLNFVPGMVLIESMAQCGGAGVKLLGITEGLFGLASIEHAKFHQGAKFNKTVRFIIKNLKLSKKIIKQSGQAFTNNKLVAEATWVCVKLD